MRPVLGDASVLRQERALPLVVPQDPEPVEDRRRVHEREEHGRRANAGPREAVVQRHGLLADPPKAEGVRDREELEVEGELLHEQERHHLLRDLAPKELEPDLRVADVELKEDAHELLVEPAADAA